MDVFVRAGTQFEFSFAQRLEKIPDLLVVTGFDLYSFKLKKTTQIDVLCWKGTNIFCFELKRFHTRIVGGFSDRIWRGTSGRRTYNIYNPVYQNTEHVRCLQRLFVTKDLKVNDFVWTHAVVVPSSCVIDCDIKYVWSDEKAITKVFESNGFRNEALLSQLWT